ncbi:MAG: hypothetical protein KAX49_00180 [Halanaerobiales bacterium]|nr:hypothetical protein [Halanaerobiales bacterium]
MKSTSKNIYAKPSAGVIFSPFNLHIEPVEKLIFITFKQDLDEVYYGFELHVLNCDINNKGIRILGWRNDGYIDVYYQPIFVKDPIFFNVAEKGLADMVERSLENVKYDLTPQGVNVSFAFKDKMGRQIEFSVKENCSKLAKPYVTLAPLGNSAENPPSLPLYYLFDYNYIRRSKTKTEVKIDGRKHKSDNFFIPIDWAKCYFWCYSTDVFMVDWNTAHNGPMPSLKPKGSQKVETQGVMYDIVQNDSHYEIKGIMSGNEKHQIRFDFSPSIPDLICLKDQVSIDGMFTISSDKATGSLSGEYKIQRHGKEIHLTCHPNGGWKPNERRWVMNFIYSIVPFYKNWPKTYIWKAKINLNENDQPTMKSYWKRINK